MSWNAHMPSSTKCRHTFATTLPGFNDDRHLIIETPAANQQRNMCKGWQPVTTCPCGCGHTFITTLVLIYHNAFCRYMPCTATTTKQHIKRGREDHYHLVCELHPYVYCSFYIYIYKKKESNTLSGLGCGLPIVIHLNGFYHTLGHYPGHAVSTGLLTLLAV